MIPLESGYYYHIYNHANGNDLLFQNENNYPFFLKKYQQHISPVAYTLAYCLMPNHFHFLIRIKEDDDLVKAFPEYKTWEKDQQNNLLSKRFSNLFSSYTQSYNKMYKRRGSLFIKNFKRKKITSEQYLKQAITYIHLNPVHHGFVDRAKDWEFSSYNQVIHSELRIHKDEVIKLFDNLKNLKAYHNMKAADIYSERLSLEY